MIENCQEFEKEKIMFKAEQLQHDQRVNSDEFKNDVRQFQKSQSNQMAKRYSDQKKMFDTINSEPEKRRQYISQKNAYEFLLDDIENKCNYISASFIVPFYMYPDNREKRLKKQCYKKKSNMMWAIDRAVFRNKKWMRSPENVKFDGSKIIEKLDKPMADAIYQVR